jgi:hypothetical protein
MAEELQFVFTDVNSNGPEHLTLQPTFQPHGEKNFFVRSMRD